jgi:hypothetical protein
MKAGKLVGLVLVLAGGALLYFGINATGSPLEALNQTLSGRYSDQTMIFLIGGGVSAVLGAAMLVKGR